MDDVRRRHALLGLLLAANAPAAAVPPAPDDDAELLSLLEFLGDAELGDDGWAGFFDSLPERLPGAPPADEGGAAPAPAPPAGKDRP